MNKKLFFVGLILAASGLLSPPLALLGGLVYGLALSHPFHVESRQLAKSSRHALRLRACT